MHAKLEDQFALTSFYFKTSNWHHLNTIWLMKLLDFVFEKGSKSGSISAGK